jgi:hypothetical protein
MNYANHFLGEQKYIQFKGRISHHPTTMLSSYLNIYILYDIVSDKWMPPKTIAINLACPALKLYDEVT